MEDRTRARRTADIRILLDGTSYAHERGHGRIVVVACERAPAIAGALASQKASLTIRSMWWSTPRDAGRRAARVWASISRVQAMHVQPAARVLSLWSDVPVGCRTLSTSACATGRRCSWPVIPPARVTGGGSVPALSDLRSSSAQAPH